MTKGENDPAEKVTETKKVTLRLTRIVTGTVIVADTVTATMIVKALQ